MSSPSKRFTQWLIVARWPLLLVAVVAACVAWPMAGQLSFDRSIENMFAADDPILEPFQQLRRTFGGNEVVMAVYVDDELLREDHRGIRRLAVIARQLEQVEGVAAVLSLDRLLVVDPEVESLNERIYLPIESRLGEAAIGLFEGYTHGADGRTAAVACMLIPEAEARVTRRETIDAMRLIMEETITSRESMEGLIKKNGFTSEEMKPTALKEGMLSGEPVMVTDGFRYIEEDGQRLGWWSTIVLSVTIWLCFRSVRWVLIPVAVVQLTLLLTKALLAWREVQMTMVSSMLTAIVTVVGIATVMHIIVRFRDARHDGLVPRPALAHAGGLIAAAIFWACSTDAAGFGSLLVAKVEPVQDFGVMMALGSLLVIVSVALLLPGLTLLGRTALRKFAARYSSVVPGFRLLSHLADDPQHVLGEGLMEARLGWLVQVAQKRPAVVAAAFILVGVAITLGTTRLTVESDFTRNFRSDSPVVTSYVFVEENLGGAGVWDVVVPAPEYLNWDYLKRILKLEDRLREEVLIADPNNLRGETEPGLTKVISIADMVVAGSPMDLDKARWPFSSDRLVSVGLKKMQQRLPEFYDALYGEDPREPGRHYMRIMLRSKERQSAERKGSIIRQVSAIVRKEFPATGPETATVVAEGESVPPNDDESAPPVPSPGGKVTGYFVLLSQLIESMVRDQWTTFGVACAGITLMMLLALRSLRLALIALVPNAFPILVVMGGMGWLGFKINMGVAMIAAVSLGLSVDSSIHYLTSFQRARRSGKSVRDSLAEVQQTVGRAVVFSTLALIVGFSVLLTSNFIPTVWFGGLVSVAMLGGLAGNLVVLPVLVTLVMPSKQNHQR